MIMKSNKDGFTLVELLVVIAIIAILVTLVTPRAFDMIENARRTACRNQLRGIGVGMLLYAGDHRGWLPARSEQIELDRNTEYAGQPPGFTYHVLKLNESEYITDPAVWKCPSDRWNGPNDNIPVFAAASFTDPSRNRDGTPFNNRNNISYMYVAGYNIATYRGAPSASPLLADESNDIENGNATPGNMPPIGEKAAHGENFRNVLWLDGSVEGRDSAEAANEIFDYFETDQAEAWELARYLQSID